MLPESSHLKQEFKKFNSGWVFTWMKLKLGIDEKT